MTIDVPAAAAFLAAHARVLERRRFDRSEGGDPEAVLHALDAYRNADGGYGWGLEPDLRTTASQPAGAMHAFDVLADVGRPTARAGELCDWLAGIAVDGALPFVTPIDDPAGVAPWFLGPEGAAPSLQMTAQVAAKARAVGRFDPAVAGHPWLADATEWCRGAIASLTAPHAYELLFSLWLVDAVGDADLLDRVSHLVPSDGRLAVAGGAEGESLHPLDIAPVPGRLVRSLFTDEVVEADLDRLEGLQQDDGGWVVDYPSFSPAAALDWRGMATVEALSVLRSNGRR